LVPAHDAAVRVEEEDAVVLDGLHHQPESLFALAELILMLPPLGEVARDLREADQPAVVAPERRDDDVGPEPAPVFAQAPPFVLDAPFRPDDLKLALGPAAGEGFGRVKDGKVLADDLFGRIAFDAPGAL